MFLGAQFENDIPLSANQRSFLAKLFKSIGNGEDLKVAFGQQRDVGERALSDDRQLKIGIVIRLIATDLAIAKLEGNALTIAEAIRRNLDEANSIMGYRIDRPVINEAKVRRWWDTKKYWKYKNPYTDAFGISPRE